MRSGGHEAVLWNTPNKLQILKRRGGAGLETGYMTLPLDTHPKDKEEGKTMEMDREVPTDKDNGTLV